MSPARLPVFRPSVQRDMQRDTRRAQHAAAFVAATERITRHIAEEIGKPGMRLLEEIGHGEKRGPAEVLEQIIVVARDHKGESAAIAPLRVLARRLGYDLAPVGDGQPARRDVVASSSEALAEVGEAVTAALQAAADGTVEPHEAAAVEQEIVEAIERLHRLRSVVSASAAMRRVEVRR